MKCGFCGYEFDETQAAKVCEKCPLGRCNLIRCPKCGYETPREPALVKWLKKRSKKHGAE